MSSTAPRTAGIWLDPLAFAKATLLPDADTPWLDAPAFAQWVSKAHGLLGHQVILIDAQNGIITWLHQQPDVLRDLKQAKGPLGWMRSLCAQPGFALWLHGLALNLRTTLPPKQWALMLPGPALLMSMLAKEVQGSSPACVDPEDAEDAAVYLANALRSIPADALDTLIVDVRLPQGDVPAGIDTLQKVATHYRWSLGVRLVQGRGLQGIKPDFAIADQLGHNGTQDAQPTVMGAAVELDQLASALNFSAELPMDFMLVRLPDTQPPEQVLGTLRALTKTY